MTKFKEFYFFNINNLKTTKLHKIKIEKSVFNNNNNKCANSLNKQLNDFQNNNNDYFHMKNGIKNHSDKKNKIIYNKLLNDNIIIFKN